MKFAKKLCIVIQVILGIFLIGIVKAYCKSTQHINGFVAFILVSMILTTNDHYNKK